MRMQGLFWWICVLITFQLKQCLEVLVHSRRTSEGKACGELTSRCH